jgi:hypothetical protein
MNISKTDFGSNVSLSCCIHYYSLLLDKMLWQEFFSTYDDDEFIAITGLTPYVFHYIFVKYCGCDTPIKTPQQLLFLFAYYKIYPVRRSFRQVFGIAKGLSARFHSQLYEWEKHLSSTMEELMQSWDDRLLPANRLPHLFDAHVTGSIDTFPVRVARPRNNEWQSNLYNGKYKGHVVKYKPSPITSVQLSGLAVRTSALTAILQYTEKTVRRYLIRRNCSAIKRIKESERHSLFHLRKKKANRD